MSSGNRPWRLSATSAYINKAWLSCEAPLHRSSLWAFSLAFNLRVRLQFVDYQLMNSCINSWTVSKWSSSAKRKLVSRLGLSGSASAEGKNRGPVIGGPECGCMVGSDVHQDALWARACFLAFCLVTARAFCAALYLSTSAFSTCMMLHAGSKHPVVM